MAENKHTELIQTLVDCALTCNMCYNACLNEEDVKHMAGCITLDRDCSDICTQAAMLLKRSSPIAHSYLDICEKICRMCADECRKHDMDHCQECADACDKCADACKNHPRNHA